MIKDYLGRLLKIRSREVNTSLIEEFKYPKLGPGELWEAAAEKVEEKGGKIITNARVTGFENEHSEFKGIKSVIYEQCGISHTVDCDYVISSMAIKDLTKGLEDVPEDILKIADGLPYRDYITMGVLVKSIKLKNHTNLKTVGNIVPDCWVYVQDDSVKTGRFQIFNNWSPYLVRDYENTIWIGMEYFCNEGDELWQMPESEFGQLVADEMIKIGLIDKKEDILDCHEEKVIKAYPAYFDTYDRIDEVISYLNGFDNLFCVGRNGQHRYNNLDHSMCTSFEAVKSLLSGDRSRDNIWSVNTEKEYHESK